MNCRDWGRLGKSLLAFIVSRPVSALPVSGTGLSDRGGEGGSALASSLVEGFLSFSRLKTKFEYS